MDQKDRTVGDYLFLGSIALICGFMAAMVAKIIGYLVFTLIISMIFYLEITSKVADDKDTFFSDED